MNCDTARIYCGAVADEELGAVPAGVLAHVRACHDCATEVSWQREAQNAVRATLAAEATSGAPPLPLVPRRWARRGLAYGSLAAVAAAAAAMLVMTGPLTTTAPVQQQPSRAPRASIRAPVESAMGDAVHAYGRPAAFHSTDAAAVSGWAAGRGVKLEVVSMPGAVLTGARISTIGGREMMTIIYTGARGTTEVTMVPGAMVNGWPAMEAMKMDDVPVALVKRVSDFVIITCPDDGALHAAMTALQAA
ncbi:MAG: hypothetical protein ABR573_05170 [Candidatus Dormibacteria bacterium]